MGKRPRASSPRHHRHSDPEAAVAVRTEDDLLEIVGQAGRRAFVLVLDGVQDPHNLGACLRSAAAAGVHAVVAPRDRAVGLTPAARSAAAGAAEQIPFVQVTNLARTLKALKKAGLWLVGTADAAEQTIYDIDLTGPLAVVMGSEGKGLRRLVAEQCDFRARIPMSPAMSCLNVSVAAGVCLFEAVRQRRQSTHNS